MPATVRVYGSSLPFGDSRLIAHMGHDPRLKDIRIIEYLNQLHAEETL